MLRVSGWGFRVLPVDPKKGIHEGSIKGDVGGFGGVEGSGVLGGRVL